MPGPSRNLWGAVFLCLCCLPRPCSAVIEALTSLEKFEKDADIIAVLQVDRLDLDKQTAVLTAAEPIKGELVSGRMPLRLAGDSEGKPRDMLDRLAVGQQVVVFVTQGDTQDIAFAYTCGGNSRMPSLTCVAPSTGRPRNLPRCCARRLRAAQHSRFPMKRNRRGWDR